MSGFTKHKTYEYRYDLVEFPETLKVAGIAKYHSGTADFVDEYCGKYEARVKAAGLALEPYTEICV